VLAHSPSIVMNGLVLALDAGNTKSYGDNTENLLTYSEQFDNAIWAKQNGFSITSNTAIAPDGTLTADTASRVNLGSEYLYQSTSASGTYTLSCWVRAVTGTTTFNMISYNGVDGTTQSPTLTATTTWQRFSLTATVTTNNGWYPCIPAVSGAQLYIWGAQLERGSSVGPYYPTTATTKTRGTTWTDLSGNNNTGTLTNGPLYSSANAGSIAFDGSNDYVSTPVSSPGSLPITFEFWINSTTSTPVGIFDSAPGQVNVLRNYSPGYLEWWPSNPNVNMGLSANTWYQIVAVYRFNTNRYIDYYRNGTLISTVMGDTNSSFTWTTFTIGNINGGSAGNYSGNLAKFAIYNRALSAAEISQNFNALRGRYLI